MEELTILSKNQLGSKATILLNSIKSYFNSILNEKTIQPIYYPSINKKNLNDFENKFEKEFNTLPNYLSLLSYDLVGLIYYLTLNDEVIDVDKLFKKENIFKGKIGIFEIKNNKINHKLNLYKIEDGELKKIF